MERKLNLKIGVLKSDRGGEYSSNDFIQLLKNEGILTERGPAHWPTANGFAERVNQTLLKRLRTQLIQSGLPLSLWGELAKYSCIQINSSPHNALGMRTPQSLIESLTQSHVHPFDPTWLKTFGSLCYATDKDQESKVGAVARRFIFVGLEEGAHTVCLWDKHTRRIFVTGNVIHFEDVFPALDKAHAPTFEHSTFHHDSDILSSLSAHSPTVSTPASAEDLTDPHPAVSPLSHVSASDAQNEVSSPSDEIITGPETQIILPSNESYESSPETDDQPIIRRSTRSTVVPD